MQARPGPETSHGTKMTMQAVLVETTRALDGQETPECLHFGSVAVVDREGRLKAYAGDPEFLTFSRSTIKPFQALPFVESGGPAHLGFGQAELAMMCASHSGEPMHVQVVQGMLAAAGCTEGRLQCGCHLPLRFTVPGNRPEPGQRFGVLENNCSGKHAGFLAWCAVHGAPMDDYLSTAHPLQRHIRRVLTEVCEVADERLAVGIDGCSAPNYALPLSRLALGYARLAAGTDAHHAHAEALQGLRDAMTARPELVSGTGRNDLALMQAGAGDWVAKVGADGVQVVGIRQAGLGVAVKIAGGDNRAACIAAIHALRELGLLGAVEGTPLEAFAASEIRNASGRVSGRMRPAFSLHAT